MTKAQSLRFDDLVLDETCLSARRNGEVIQFTRNERALLLAFTGNPRRLMPRSRLLEEIDSSEADRSDRYVDFLVNRLRVKLGDSKRTPRYIATQYGEGYVWVASPSPAAPIDAFLVIGGIFGPQELVLSPQVSSALGQLRNLVAVGIDPEVTVIAGNWHPAATDTLRYFLPMSLRAADGRLECTAALREMPSKCIVKTFRFQLDMMEAESSLIEMSRVGNGVIDVLRQALADAATGLGAPTDDPLEKRLNNASALLSASNLQWLTKGEQLLKERERNPFDPDLALQWCMHLFARLVATSPIGGMSQEEREGIESELEATALEFLPVVEGRPLLMLTAAKQLYFIDRGHLELAEDIAGRAFARIADYAAALPIMGQLRYARGRFDEAIDFFDRGMQMTEPGPAFYLHMKVLKCLACLAAGDRAALDAASVDLDAYLGPFCTPDLAATIRLTFAGQDRELPEALVQTLAAMGPAGARNAIEYVHFTSARHLATKHARANVMAGLIAHVTQRYGEDVVPAFVQHSIGQIS
jgi:DNA-binding winged helix-turn-helix (wHTH) protein/tetratricopeptide (TPR) repeat protein